jgi:hypothetical protein
MKKIGLYFISFWVSFNLLLAVGILISIFLLGKNAPAITILFSESDLKSLDPKVIATINSIAVLLNAVIAAFCFLSITLFWRFHFQADTRVFWIVSGSLLFVQIFGFASDYFLGNTNLLPNVLSSCLLLIGIGLYIGGLFKNKQAPSGNL